MDRFHVLQEFDEGKRSCRRRLAGHNRRRRKTHPDTTANGGSLNDERGSSYLLISLLRILSNMHCKPLSYLSHIQLSAVLLDIELMLIGYMIDLLLDAISSVKFLVLSCSYVHSLFIFIEACWKIALSLNFY